MDMALEVLARCIGGKGLTGVSILVLMDMALEAGLWLINGPIIYVSILVLMDMALEEPPTPSSRNFL